MRSTRTRHPSCACSSTRWCHACSRPRTTHLAAGLSCGSEETCASAGTPNSPRNSRKTVGCVKRCRPAVRRRRLEARIAAGDLKRCSAARQGKPLTEYPDREQFLPGLQERGPRETGVVTPAGRSSVANARTAGSRSPGPGQKGPDGSARPGARSPGNTHALSPEPAPGKVAAGCSSPHDERSMYCSRECGAWPP